MAWTLRKAYGFLASLIQHEIDHCRSKMCIDNYDLNAPPDSQKELLPFRKGEVKKRRQEMGVGEEDYFPLVPIESFVKEESF